MTRLRGYIFAVTIMAFVARSASGQTVVIPPAQTLPEVSAQLVRDKVVIEFNACGREGDYADRRSELANQNYDKQGEPLTEILLGKAAWIEANEGDPHAACHGVRIRLAPKNPDGSLLEPITQFAIKDQVTRANELSACETETGVTLNVDSLAVNVALDATCMRRQINDAIVAMKKTRRLGTSGDVCLDNLQLGLTFNGIVPSVGLPGDYDVNNRDLVRLFYFAAGRNRRPGLLDQSTIDYMYRNLLAARGSLGPDGYSLLHDCYQPAGDQLGSPEDTADQHDAGNAFWNGLGDVANELLSLFCIAFGVDVMAAGDVLGAGFVLLGDNSPAQLFAPDGDLNIPETENHRLMIETSRYLTNAAIIAKLSAENYDHVDSIQSQQTDVRNWLLQRLQSIAKNDFDEYNSRPYTRYSLNAILNLYDFAGDAGDTDLQTAAQIVLDLSEAKFAAMSNRGRRIVPFRRRSEYEVDDSASDPTGITDLYDEGDHEIARAMLLGGQTQLLQNGVYILTLGDLVYPATERYALPEPVQAAIVERRVASQTVRHAGVEMAFQSPAFTISAGGLKTPPAVTVFFGKISTEYDSNAGVASQTTIIPTIAGNNIADVFRFEGVGARDKRSDNLCVAANFACGIQPEFPSMFGKCPEPQGAPPIFISSARCFPGLPGPHFYLAFLIAPCTGTFCGAGSQWGVVEAVEATPPANAGSPGVDDPAFDRFVASRQGALAAIQPDTNGKASYVTFDNRRIDFTLTEQKPEVTAIDGIPRPPWATTGDLFVSDGAGHATIAGKGGPITIDFSDWNHPKRSSP
jgi:hypothetical protein